MRNRAAHPPEYSYDEAEKVLVAAENLRLERNRRRFYLTGHGWRAVGFFGAPALSAALASCALAFLPPEIGPGPLLVVPAALAASAALLAVPWAMDALRTARKARTELAATERALREMVRLLRRTRDASAGEWPTLLRAQFGIRLRRLETGVPSQPDETTADAEALA